MLTNCCTPELTSVDNRLETQTHQLVQTLLGVLAGEEMPKKSISLENHKTRNNIILTFRRTLL